MAIQPRFIDSNVFLRYLLKDDPTRSQAAFELLARVNRGEERVITNSIVMFEVIFSLQRKLKLPKADVRDSLMYLLELDQLVFPERQLFIDALHLFVEKNIAFGDAFIAVSTARDGIAEIYSWDADFDRLPGVARIEPV
jgi:uncharacterized protein